MSLGVIDKEDMTANYRLVAAILNFLNEGQAGIAWDYMTILQNDIKTSMSVDGRLIDKITSSEIRYSTTQTLHEYQHQQKKKGLIPGGKNVS